jgi:membrane associated rhomboid family serine protease
MYGGQVRRDGAVDATRVLIGINLVVFILTLANGGGLFQADANADIYRKFALIPADIASGEWWRLISSMFLHYGLPHIFFNMWALLVIGTPLEAMLGRFRFVVLYVLSGFGGGLLSMAFGSIGERAAGASGAIFGLFGAFYVITRRRGLETGPIVGLIGINLVFSFTFSGIDWRGHVGGLIVGSVVAFALAWAPSGPRRDPLQAAGCLVVSVVLVASGFAAASHVRHECKTVLQALPPSAQDIAACHDAGLPIA